MMTVCCSSVGSSPGSNGSTSAARACAAADSVCTVFVRTPQSASVTQGLTLAYFKAQFEDLRDTSLPIGLNLSTFGTRPRLKVGYIGDKVSLS